MSADRNPPLARTLQQALLVFMIVVLQGCGVLRGNGGEQAEELEESTVEATEGEPVFQVKVVSENRSIARHLERHLELQRYTRFPDLQATEFNRLLAEADANARDLLAALGYFNPELTLRVDAATEGSAEPRTIVIEVEPGEQTKVASHSISFADPMNSDPKAAAQRERIQRTWPLRDGDSFTQPDWSSAKNAGLRELQKVRYPTARIADSQAAIDADQNRASLRVHYDPGPPYRFGEVRLTGVERYDAQGILNIARLPTGADYSEEALLDAQQRLATSGYFDSAFLMLDTEDSDPERAAVIAQLREARYQKVVFGVGLTTDAGPRVSIDHVHNQLWPLGWRAVSRLSLDAKSQAASTMWTDMPQRSGWAWFLGAGLERTEVGDFKSNSVSLQGGRTKNVGHIDRRYFLQYDMSKVQGGDAPGSASSLMANYDWTGRYFNDKINPTAGYGLGAEAGAGFTLTPKRDPFLRLRLHALQFWPLGQRDENGRQSRLALRGELGAVVADDHAQLPSSLLFLTGGDITVRGYGYRSIGTRSIADKLYGGRYVAVGSLEWQRPITLMGNQTDWEHTLFIDLGSVSDDLDDMNVQTGVGTGIRWNSPVGPMQADVAYGVERRQVRLHLRLGFSF
ncbi:MAG: BamA/TamA family outer membrane protein [Burkholderiaceae bacterium]